MLTLSVIDPVAFSLGPLQVHWYGIILGSAALIGLWLAVREADRLGFNSELLLDMMIWVIPAAIVGARLYYVAFEWEHYSLHPEDILAVWKGGLAIHGGLIGAFAAGYFFVRKHQLRFLVLADIVAPSIILGQAIGRWGNFMNQEAHGGPVSRSFLEGLHLPDWIIDQMNIQGTYYHPTFLYESLWNLVGFALLLVLRYLVHPRRGEIFFSYLIWYSMGRFYIEGLRTDSLTFEGPAWLAQLLNAFWSPMTLLFEPGSMEDGNIRIAQLVSLLLVLFAVLMIIWRRATGRAKEKYNNVELRDQQKVQMSEA
ncbi:prolipoprotein diacylglyceryl transferase [Lihuaxuella thermophila]|uniref:Phosphatidylglycerol--prolipoprotein diacylglyceryl transferase n=1 Tax=Lihuaxuella thermophila TaxID=1173111 RepID=A0A1H8GUG4_9BACL|nr:prolipoprotein diacylglyceryl transferase [Lihuaxuella thermophila]SEN47596.1 phosphatidylglycerol:prolipoprotein diacylglycerol transferase [Lihuaxuella thermophila]